MAIRHHAVDHIIAAVDGGLTVAERMIIIGPLGQRREIGCLGKREFLHGLAKIIQCGGGNAIIAQTEINLVQVQFEDAVLRIS